MKIKFLIGNPPFKAISEWDELKSYKGLGILVPTKEFYSLIKALERNTKFEEAILTARKNLGFPAKGVTWQSYDKLHNPHLTSVKMTEKQRTKEIELFTKVAKEVIEIRKKLDLDYSVLEQLRHLIYGNFVYPEYPPIVWGISPVSEDNDEEYYNHISIMINNPVTKNELITFIEDRWDRIKESISNLPPRPSYYISPRDQRIITLRDKDNMPFKKIADMVIKEFDIDDFEGKVNEDSVKTAYKRAKDKIASLTGKSKSNN